MSSIVIFDLQSVVCHDLLLRRHVDHIDGYECEILANVWENSVPMLVSYFRNARRRRMTSRG